MAAEKNTGDDATAPEKDLRGTTAGDTDPDAAEEEAEFDAPQVALRRAQAGAREKGLRPGSRAPARRRKSPGRGDVPSSAGRDGRDPQSLGDAADALSRLLGWAQPLSIGGVIGRWPEVVGPQIAEHCTPETFEEGALVVRASSTAWATQIRLLLPQLERRLAEDVGEGVVTSIQVLGPGGPTWRKGPRGVRGRGPRDTYG